MNRDDSSARAWLAKHGTERRSKVGDGFRVLVSAHGAGAEAMVLDGEPAPSGWALSSVLA
jgi:hypothetical protein